MSCISHANLCPSSGDNENVLLQKILQSINEGGGGLVGVSSISVNGGAAQTGAVSITIPGALLNFQDQNGGLDGVAYRDAGTVEVFRTQSGTGNVRFSAGAPRLHTTSALTDSFTFLATDSKANGAFLEVSGTGAAGLGGGAFSIHDGGVFQIRSAPVASTVSVLRTVVVGTTGFMGIGTLTTPVTELMVQSVSAADPRGIMSAQYSADAVGARFHFRKSRGATAGTDTLIVTGDIIGRTRYSGYDGANYLQMAGIDVGVSGTVAATRIPTYMAFSTATDATPSVLTERVRINNLGYVGVGTNPVPTSRLHIFTGAGLAGGSGIKIEQQSEGTISTSYSGIDFVVPTTGLIGQFIATANNYSSGGAVDLAVNSVGLYAEAASGELVLGAGGASGIVRIVTGGFNTTKNRVTVSAAGLVGIGPSKTPGTSLDVNNGTNTTIVWVYHTTDGLAAPTNYSRIALSHNAAGAGNQKANFAAETGGTGADNIDVRLSPSGTGSVFLDAGVPLVFASGTNTRAGNATLVAGTVTVANTTVTATTVIMLTRKTSGGTIGTAITYTISAATSFTITSDSVLDTSTFSYLLIGNHAS